mmetsp:Transcript_30638/g.73466  ORF Transcript_30638/g.73466 Transcript_30638/m.73466 type:complete len:267 (-) Transcript_30638:1068-1868(-)
MTISPTGKSPKDSGSSRTCSLLVLPSERLVLLSFATCIGTFGESSLRSFSASAPAAAALVSAGELKDFGGELILLSSSACSIDLLRLFCILSFHFEAFFPRLLLDLGEGLESVSSDISVLLSLSGLTSSALGSSCESGNSSVLVGIGLPSCFFSSVSCFLFSVSLSDLGEFVLEGPVSASWAGFVDTASWLSGWSDGGVLSISILSSSECPPSDLLRLFFSLSFHFAALLPDFVGDVAFCIAGCTVSSTSIISRSSCCSCDFITVS